MQIKLCVLDLFTFKEFHVPVNRVRQGGISSSMTLNLSGFQSCLDVVLKRMFPSHPPRISSRPSIR